MTRSFHCLFLCTYPKRDISPGCLYMCTMRSAHPRALWDELRAPDLIVPPTLVPSANGKYNHCVYSLYSVLLAFVLMVSAPWWLLEMLRHGKYRRGWRERLGKVPSRVVGKDLANTIWIHAVSVGEVLAISRVIEELKLQLPAWRIVISTTTDTGQKLARERFGEDNVFYVPLDLPFAIRRYLQALRPKLLVLAESEFWPNLLHLTERSGAAVAVVNARVSNRSFVRYLRFRNLLRRVLANVQLFLAQSDEDARRLVQVGAPSEIVRVGGNLKFEVKLPPEPAINSLMRGTIEREEAGPILVAGSTLEGEETLLVQTFQAAMALYPKATLLLAPRHPERFAAVASLLAQSGAPFQRRSEWDGKGLIAGSVFLLDTIGELGGLYEFADLAFVGGSLVPRGGHNILEAAHFGVPILVGPHTENFRDIVQVFHKAEALRVVTPQSLTATILQLLQDDDGRVAMGQRAKAIMRTQQGATTRTVRALLDLLPETAVAAGHRQTSETGA